MSVAIPLLLHRMCFVFVCMYRSAYGKELLTHWRQGKKSGAQGFTAHPRLQLEQQTQKSNSEF